MTKLCKDLNKGQYENYWAETYILFYKKSKTFPLTIPSPHRSLNNIQYQSEVWAHFLILVNGRVCPSF